MGVADGSRAQMFMGDGFTHVKITFLRRLSQTCNLVFTTQRNVGQLNKLYNNSLVDFRHYVEVLHVMSCKSQKCKCNKLGLYAGSIRLITKRIFCITSVDFVSRMSPLFTEV